MGFQKSVGTTGTRGGMVSIPRNRLQTALQKRMAPASPSRASQAASPSIYTFSFKKFRGYGAWRHERHFELSSKRMARQGAGGFSCLALGNRAWNFSVYSTYMKTDFGSLLPFVMFFVMMFWIRKNYLEEPLCQ